jgi:hypothetical protein
LAALHTHLVRQFQTMVDQHRPGCAFVSAYPQAYDPMPNEIVVVPFRCGAALFSVGFVTESGATRLVVRIGNHGQLECIDADHAIHAFAGTAEWLFGIALSGRYREEIRRHSSTGRLIEARSYVLDDARDWRELDPPPSPHSRHLEIALEHRPYQPY